MIERGQAHGVSAARLAEIVQYEPGRFHSRSEDDLFGLPRIAQDEQDEPKQLGRFARLRRSASSLFSRTRNEDDYHDQEQEQEQEEEEEEPDEETSFINNPRRRPGDNDDNADASGAADLSPPPPYDSVTDNTTAEESGYQPDSPYHDLGEISSTQLGNQFERATHEKKMADAWLELILIGVLDNVYGDILQEAIESATCKLESDDDDESDNECQYFSTPAIARRNKMFDDMQQDFSPIVYNFKPKAAIPRFEQPEEEEQQQQQLCKVNIKGAES